jgi:hypothetical protein
VAGGRTYMLQVKECETSGWPICIRLGNWWAGAKSGQPSAPNSSFGAKRGLTFHT